MTMKQGEKTTQVFVQGHARNLEGRVMQTLRMYKKISARKKMRP